MRKQAAQSDLSVRDWIRERERVMNNIRASLLADLVKVRTELVAIRSVKATLNAGDTP